MFIELRWIASVKRVERAFLRLTWKFPWSMMGGTLLLDSASK